MKILLFWSEITYYHAARIQVLIDLADQKGHQIFPISLRNCSPEIPLNSYYQILGDRVDVLSFDDPRAGPNSIKTSRLLLTKLSSINPDAVAIIGYDGIVSQSALIWCRLKRKAAILMCESQEIDFPRSLWKEWLKARIVGLYDAALTGGKPQADYAQKLGIEKDSIRTGYAAIDNDFFSDRANQARANADYWRINYALPERYFLCVCRFVPKKNLIGLIDAFQIYLQAIDEDPWSLILIGDGTLEPRLKSHVRELGIEDRVSFPGYQTINDLGFYYGLASAFVLASNRSEQWGLVVNEAMAAGLPVLVSEICGCVQDLIIEGVTGFTFNPSQLDKLTDLLVWCSQNDPDLDRIGMNARNHIQKFSLENFAEKFIEVSEIGIMNAQRRKRKFF